MFVGIGLQMQGCKVIFTNHLDVGVGVELFRNFATHILKVFIASVAGD
jgi:hypothetical protein